MPIIAKNEGSGVEYTPCPAGVHQAVCYNVTDVGWQETPFKNDDGTDKIQHKVVVLWELDPRMEDGRRFALSRQYTLSLNDRANLRKDLESWLGRQLAEDEIETGYDVEGLVGINCLLNVVHEKGKDDKVRAKIKAIMPAPANSPSMNPENFDAPRWVTDLVMKQVANPYENTGRQDKADEKEPPLPWEEKNPL